MIIRATIGYVIVLLVLWWLATPAHAYPIVSEVLRQQIEEKKRRRYVPPQSSELDLQTYTTPQGSSVTHYWHRRGGRTTKGTWRILPGGRITHESQTKGGWRWR